MKLFVPLLDNGNGDVKANFMVCFVEAFKGRDIHLVRASDSLAQRGMNKVANDFLRSECEWWINIDADIYFTRRDIDNLLSHGDKPLIYGLYPKKQEDCPPCIGTFSDLPIPDAENLATVRRCGRGFMLVNRSLLQRMKFEAGGPAAPYHNHEQTEWDFFSAGVVTGSMSSLADGAPEFISEDWYFCERARALGVSTLVDVRIALGHEGAKVYRFGPDQCERYDGWRGIPGWFTDADAEVYRTIARAIPPDGTVAEVGTWLGRSMAALVSFCREENKEPTILAIDTFKGTENEGAAQLPIVAAHGGSILTAFRANMRDIGLVEGEQLSIFGCTSLEAAARLTDGTLDAVFIDGDHSFEAVRADVAAWLLKVKAGGIIAGHDYDYDSVRCAVREVLPFGKFQIETIGRCWLVKL